MSGFFGSVLGNSSSTTGSPVDGSIFKDPSGFLSYFSPSISSLSVRPSPSVSINQIAFITTSSLTVNELLGLYVISLISHSKNSPLSGSSNRFCGIVYIVPFLTFTSVILPPPPLASKLIV